MRTSMSDQHEIGYVVNGYVATITLNRPAKLNAMTPEMSGRLIELAAEIDRDDNVRVVVIRGTGRSFSVGSDIRELDTYESNWHFRNRRDYCDAVRSIRKPVIAAVHGYAYGGGLELALSSDVRIAAASATFCAAEIKLGWTGGGGVTALLNANVSASDTMLLLLTGDPISADEALRMGLLSRVVADDQLLEHCHTLAATIATRAPIAAISAKANLRAALAMPLESAIQYERELQAVCMSTADADEGRAAFAAKRAPVFSGR